MADEPQAVEQAEQTAPESAPETQAAEPQSAVAAEGAEVAQGAEESKPGDFIPRERLNEEIAKRRELEEQLSQVQTQEPGYEFDAYAPQPVYQDQQDPWAQYRDEDGQIPADVFYAKTQQDAAQAAVQQVRADLAWRDAESEHPELKANPNFRKAVMGMLYSESVASGKVITPSQASKMVKSLTAESAKEAVKAQQVQETMQNQADLIQGGADVSESVSAERAEQERRERLQSPDKDVRTKAILEALKAK